MTKSEQIQKVKDWWGANVVTHPAWRTDDLPGPHFKDTLIALELCIEIRRDTIILSKPRTDPQVLLTAYFWEVLTCILRAYAPYLIIGVTAMNHYLENMSIPKELEVMTQNSSTRIALLDISQIVIEKSPWAEQKNRTCSVAVGSHLHYKLNFESPESILVRLRPSYLRNYPQLVSAFLKGIDFNLDKLNALLLEESRPVIYSRLAALFEQVGKTTEARLIHNSIKATTSYTPPGRGPIARHALPPSVATTQNLSELAYVTRFRDQLRVYAQRLETDFSELRLPTWNLNKILKFANKIKKHDTYHSSTIEGYRVTPEEIQTLIEGRSSLSSTTGMSREEIERRIALKGYLAAHSFVLEQVQRNNNPSLTEQLIREIYARLFSPTVEAGLLTSEQLKKYRTEPVYIRGSRHVPPNPAKVPELMRCLVEEVNEIENLVVRAAIAHYGFVTVHPYLDGNGRVSRFLMNYLLIGSGKPWLTIRVEDREAYFRALEVAQCDEDIAPFSKLLKKYYEETPSKFKLSRRPYS